MITATTADVTLTSWDVLIIVAICVVVYALFRWLRF